MIWRTAMQGIDTDEQLITKIDEAMLAGEAASIEYISYTKEGAKFWSALSITPVSNSVGELEHFVGVYH